VALHHLAGLYRAFIRLYPSDLRNEYGADMAAAFEQLIRDEYMRRGTRGVLAVSASAFAEFFTVALPRHFRSDWLIASLLSLIITSSVLGSLVGVMTAQIHCRPAARHGIVLSCR
jgi:hypothetical protein